MFERSGRAVLRAQKIVRLKKKIESITHLSVILCYLAKTDMLLTCSKHKCIWLYITVVSVINMQLLMVGLDPGMSCTRMEYCDMWW